MTEEDKKLLLKDLSARLTYDVKVYVKNWSKLDRKYYEGVYTVKSTDPSLNTVLACSDKCCVDVIVGYDDYIIKPYLFPLSSITEEQEEEFKNLYYRFHESAFIFNERFAYDRYSIKDIGFYPCYLQDWLNKNHFDYRGLIEKGLANDATGLKIY